MADDTQWGPWLPHKAGDPCPIPDAKAGEYGLRFADGEEGCVQPFKALWWSKGINSWGRYNSPGLTITHYRLRKPPVDWKGIAEELAAKLDDVLDWSQDIATDTKDEEKAVWRAESVDAGYAALTRYREAIK